MTVRSTAQRLRRARARAIAVGRDHRLALLAISMGSTVCLLGLLRLLTNP